MTIYTIRAGFTITLGSTVYQGGNQIDLTPEQFELHKHKLEGAEATVLPIVLAPRSISSNPITFDDRSSNIVNGNQNADLQSGITAIDQRLDALQMREFTLSSGNRVVTGPAFNLTPNVGDRWNEQTAGGARIEDWYWNGTYWLSNQIFSVQNNDRATSFNIDSPLAVSNMTANFYLTNFKLEYAAYGTQNTSNYWQLILYRISNTNGYTALNINDTINTTAGVYFTFDNTLNTHINIAAVNLKTFVYVAQRTGNPGQMIFTSTLYYQKARI